MIIINGAPNVSDDLTAVSGQISTVDGIVDAIKLSTDALPTDPADQSDIDAKLGAVTDFAAHQTLLGYQNSLYQHVHSKAIVYPTLAAGKVVTGGADAWALGAVTEIIAAATEPFASNAFDIHFINFEAASANDTYELVLYSGADEALVEIGRVRTKKYSATDSVVSVPIQIPSQTAGTRITAKVASASGGEDTVTISVYAHLYS